MKYKIPTDVQVHPDSGEQLRFDPRGFFDTSSGDRLIPIQAIGCPTQRGPGAKLKRWARALNRGE